jgi:hypothetical protein
MREERTGRKFNILVLLTYQEIFSQQLKEYSRAVSYSLSLRNVPHEFLRKNK